MDKQHHRGEDHNEHHGYEETIGTCQAPAGVCTDTRVRTTEEGWVWIHQPPNDYIVMGPAETERLTEILLLLRHGANPGIERV